MPRVAGSKRTYQQTPACSPSLEFVRLWIMGFGRLCCPSMASLRRLLRWFVGPQLATLPGPRRTFADLLATGQARDVLGRRLSCRSCASSKIFTRSKLGFESGGALMEL